MAKSIRDAYGDSLLKYGKDNKAVVALDADVSSSTKSGVFGAACPDRFFNVGISEQNMMGMAAGLSTTGKIPFVNTFTAFLCNLGAMAAKGLLSYGNLNVKMMGAYSGMSDAYDGPSHHALEDIAQMRVLPNFTVLVASDEYLVDWMVKTAIEHVGPMYIRLSRDNASVGYTPDTRFELGKGKVVAEGNDATVFACGVMVSKAVEAAQALADEGIKIRVVDMFTIKPLDKELIKKCAEETGLIITAEEHSIIGGLGGAVCECLGDLDVQVPVERVGMKDRHGETGAYQLLLSKYGMDAKAIAEAVRRGLKRKK